MLPYTNESWKQNVVLLTLHFYLPRPKVDVGDRTALIGSVAQFSALLFYEDKSTSLTEEATTSKFSSAPLHFLGEFRKSGPLPKFLLSAVASLFFFCESRARAEFDPAM